MAIKWGRKNLKTLQELTIELASQAVTTFMVEKETPYKQTGRRKTESPEEEQPTAKKAKPAGEGGFTMGATVESDNKVFYPTVEPDIGEPVNKSNLVGEKEKEKEKEKEQEEGTKIKEKRTPRTRGPLRNTKPGGSQTENTELPVPKLQTEARTQTFGIYERQKYTQKKYENWSLTPKKPILFLGDSNLANLPKIENDKIQIVSYPGGKNGACLPISEK